MFIPSSWNDAREEVLLFSRRMLAERLVFYTAGNISCRVAGEPDVLAVTPSAVAYDTMRPEDVVIVRVDGEILAGDLVPTSELPLHLLVYGARPEVGGVVHTHSPAAMAMAASNRTLPPILTGQVSAAGGPIVTAPFARPGTPELADSCRAALADVSACFLRHHGLLAIGASVEQAYNTASVVEGAAEAYLLALAVGNVDVMPPEEVAYMRQKWLRRWPATVLPAAPALAARG
jgi:ribulose-5-phosphate 4-epimerase/fuculose-1-phosphate aldolase